jgi:Fe-S-cluster containining protein
MSAEQRTPLRVLSVPRHTCNHCSACCSSYSVGPLLPDDYVRVQAAIPLVKQAFPDQDLDHCFTEREYHGATTSFLAKRDGYCVFWRRGTGCTIHSAVSPEAKPLVCQMFPMQIVKTATGLRLGVRPTCLSDETGWEDGPVVDGDFIERIVDDTRGWVVRDEIDGEDIALKLLSVPDIDTGSIVAFLAGADRDDPPSIDGWLEERLQALFVEFDEIGDQGPLHRGTSTADLLAEFRAWHATRADAGSWPEVPDDALPWIRDAMRRLVFLRQTKLHATIAWALLAYVAAARYAAAWAADGAEGLDRRKLGRGFSTWLIVMENPRLQRTLVEAGPPFAGSDAR